MTGFVAAILVVSIILQVSAAVAAILQVKAAGPFRFAWISVSTALLLMIERRVEPLIFLQEQTDLRLTNNIVGLLISVAMAIGIFGLRSLFKTLQRQDEMLRRLAATDPLTGLANRRSLEESAQREIRLSRRSGRPLALLMLDLDHFKKVNDLLGHHAGDQVLVRIADKLRACLRNVDHVGRWGGEEFMVLLPAVSSQDAMRIAERMCAETRDANEGNVSVTVSIGVTVFQPGGASEADDFAALVERADCALYHAKQDGRNCIRMYRTSAPPALLAELTASSE